MQLFNPDEATELSRRRRKQASINLNASARYSAETVTIPSASISAQDLANLLCNETSTCTDRESSSEKRDQMMIILDCRSFLEFNNSHIITAVNICTSKIIKRRLERDQVNKLLTGHFISITQFDIFQMTVKQLLEHAMKCELLNNRISHIIIYDHVGMSGLSRDSFTWVIMEKLKSWISSNVVQYVSEGFVGFKSNFPGLCSKSGGASLDPSSVCCKGEKVTSDGSLFTRHGDTGKGGDDGNSKEEEEDDGPSLILPFLYLGSMKDAQDQQVLRVSSTDSVDLTLTVKKLKLS